WEEASSPHPNSPSSFPAHRPRPVPPLQPRASLYSRSTTRFRSSPIVILRRMPKNLALWEAARPATENDNQPHPGFSPLLLLTLKIVKTYTLRGAEIDKKWRVFDAEGQALGRLATQIAIALRGKNKPT